MTRNNSSHRPKQITSSCGDLVFKGDVHHLVRAYEAKAYEAERNHDQYNIHLYFQYADHYKRLAAGEV